MLIALNFVGDFLFIFFLLLVVYFCLRPIVHGAIYFSTTIHGVETIMEVAEVKEDQKIIDLGSGDGRIVIACAKLGAEVVGYEINPFLVWRSNRAIRRAKLEDRAIVHWESFWNIDLSGLDTIIVYGIPHIMRDLEKKFARELRPGTKIISNAFPFPNLKLIKKEALIYLYIWGK